MTRKFNILLVLPIFYFCYLIFNDSFVYKSFFFYYLLILATCILLIYPFLLRVFGKEVKFNFSFATSISILLIALPFIITGITGKAEWYFLSYFVSVFVLFFALTINLNNNFIQQDKIDLLIIGFALCESIICILQNYGIIESETIFHIRGTNINPNITAMFLVMSLPLILQKLIQAKKTERIIFMISIILIIFFTLYLLKSRTAYIGTFIILIASLFYYLKRLKKVNNYLIYSLTILFVTGGIFLIPKLYELKKNSADGRQFIWKVSTNMIAHKPIAGYGYGMVQRSYNMAQADYFKNNTTTEIEKQNATYVTNIFNDYLEMFIQGGLLGGVLYILFIVSVLVSGLYAFNELFYQFIGVSAFIIMSCFNFAFYSPEVVLIFAYFAAIICIKTKQRSYSKPINRHPSNLIVFTGIAFLIYFGIQAYSQTQLKIAQQLIQEKKPIEAKELINDNVNFISTSELYYRTLGDIQRYEKKYDAASKFYSIGFEYSSTPQVAMQIAYCEFLNKNYDYAIKYLKIASRIQPALFEPIHSLMKIYYYTGNKETAKYYAHILLNKKIKVNSDKIQKYKFDASKLLNNN